MTTNPPKKIGLLREKFADACFVGNSAHQQISKIYPKGTVITDAYTLDQLLAKKAPITVYVEAGQKVKNKKAKENIVAPVVEEPQEQVAPVSEELEEQIVSGDEDVNGTTEG